VDVEARRGGARTEESWTDASKVVPRISQGRFVAGAPGKPRGNTMRWVAGGGELVGRRWKGEKSATEIHGLFSLKLLTVF
jgi:hypothetical protein